MGSYQCSLVLRRACRAKAASFAIRAGTMRSTVCQWRGNAPFGSVRNAGLPE